MYRHETSGGRGCGCGGSAPVSRTGSSRGRQLGRIDADGQCVCDECETCGLPCLCRPRFFDGQLVTAADFRRLDAYIVGKSRLHNRYLHGVGVVCGLEAVCSPCEDSVTVRSGYALGPCGEDIVVCADAKVDVQRLIMEQRAAVARSDCAPYSEPTQDAEAARQRWVLAICYDETPSRPVTTLKRAGGCGCGGSCGGSGGGCGGSCGGSGGGAGSGGCGCGGSGSTGAGTCEPTQICEGYRFVLTKVRPTPVKGDRGSGLAASPALAEGLPGQVMACLRRLSSGLSQLPQNPTDDALVDYARELKEELRELIETGNLHDCTLAQRLFDIPIPDPRDDQVTVKARAALTAMLQIAVDLFRDCVCSALLPTCAEACEDDCVPLAVLTVRSSDLRVLEICNWSARQFAITMPTLQYWLGWIPIFGALRDALVRLCCGQRRVPEFGFTDTLRVREARSAAAPPPAAQAPGAPMAPSATSGASTRRSAASETVAEPAAFAALASHYTEAWTSLSGLEATVLGALGARSARGGPLASDLELEHPLAALTLGHLGVEAASSLLPPDLAQRFAAPARGQAAAEPDRLSVLEESMAKLKKTVDTQARTIRDLRAKGPDQ